MVYLGKSTLDFENFDFNQRKGDVEQPRSRALEWWR
ncbi:MAG: hypothetical protein JWM11_394 [Planctomycetaceae bacterium]|nr:hypothetical protein [Planctomycetaceae bacterium]